MAGFVKVANEVFTRFRKPAHRLVAFRLYELGDGSRWRPFRCSDGYLMEAGVSKRDVRAVLADLESMGLIRIVFPGDRNNPRLVEVFDPIPQSFGTAENEIVNHADNAESLPFGESGPRLGPRPELKIQTTDKTQDKRESENASELSAPAVADWILDTLEAIKGKRPDPSRCKTDAAEIRKFQRRSGLSPAEFATSMTLVALAARQSPDKLFAYDVRAEGWDGGTDRSRSVSTLVVAKKWGDRLDAAERWRDDGMPAAGPVERSTGNLKAEAQTVLGKVNGFIRDTRWRPSDLGDGVHAAAARAAIAACGGIDEFRRSSDEIGDRLTFVAAYIEHRQKPSPQDRSPS